jgi:hypothetical protein
MTAALTARPAAEFETVERTLSAFDGEIEVATKKLAKLNKRLAKLGAPAATMAIGDTRIVEDRETGLSYNITELTVTGVIGKWNGWTALASLDWTVPTATGEAWITKFPAARGADDDKSDDGIEIPARFRNDKTCSACGTKRARNVTSLWVNDNGEFATLGSNCVLDFIGVDPSTALWLAGNAGVGNEEEMFGPNREADMRPSVASFLAAAEVMTEAFGFVSTSSYDGIPTRDMVGTFMGGRWTDAEKKLFADLPETSVETGNTIAAWVLANMTGNSDFESSARLAVETGITHRRTVGILAFLPTAKRKAEATAVEAEAVKAAEVPSFHIGAIKERIKGIAVTITGDITIETNFGTSKRINGVGVDGAKVSTFGSGRDLFGLTVGDSVLWTGTVKEHADDKFGIVTNFARVKLVVLDADGNPVPEFVRNCYECGSGIVHTDSLDPMKGHCDPCFDEKGPS